MHYLQLSMLSICWCLLKRLRRCLKVDAPPLSVKVVPTRNHRIEIQLARLIVEFTALYNLSTAAPIDPQPSSFLSPFPVKVYFEAGTPDLQIRHVAQATIHEGARVREY
jgi:hypothetical protein